MDTAYVIIAQTGYGSEYVHKPVYVCLSDEQARTLARALMHAADMPYRRHWGEPFYWHTDAANAATDRLRAYDAKTFTDFDVQSTGVDFVVQPIALR